MGHWSKLFDPKILKTTFKSFFSISTAHKYIISHEITKGSKMWHFFIFLSHTNNKIVYFLLLTQIKKENAHGSDIEIMKNDDDN